MTISVDLLESLVYSALLLCAVAPVVLIFLMIRDWKTGEDRLKGVATIMTRLVRLAEEGGQQAA